MDSAKHGGHHGMCLAPRWNRGGSCSACLAVLSACLTLCSWVPGAYAPLQGLLEWWQWMIPWWYNNNYDWNNMFNIWELITLKFHGVIPSPSTTRTMQRTMNTNYVMNNIMSENYSTCNGGKMTITSWTTTIRWRWVMRIIRWCQYRMMAMANSLVI